MQKYKFILLVISILTLMMHSSCTEDSEDNSSKDSDSDMDSSGGSDTDMVTDSDTESDGDVDSDTNSDKRVFIDAGDHTGYFVDGRFLYDSCGERVILRGINKMTVWTDIKGDAFPEIAKTGANSVRIVWVMTGSTADMDAAIGSAIENGLIPMIELHDATGVWEDLGSLVDWWVQPEVVAVIQKYEKDLLVNIGNEVGDNVTDADFKTGYEDAITRMRSAGYNTPLIIDGSRWGQNIDILQSTGPGLLAHDPDSNLMFSVHMWWPTEYYPDPENKVMDEISESVEMELPLVIGEFAHLSAGCTPAIPYLKIIEEAQANDIGWLAWSWGPGNNDCESMNMTTDSTFETLHDWGLEVATTDPNSIANTSLRPFSIVNRYCQ